VPPSLIRWTRCDICQTLHGRACLQNRGSWSDSLVSVGSVDDSEALRRIHAEDPTEQMPPGGKDKRLTAEQIGLLERWVEQGAVWESHWAFEKPVRAPLPAVNDRRWPGNPIDAYVLARLEREGLRPSPQADRATLVRRVCLGTLRTLRATHF
jgi:Planctomycete cytochrome C